MSTVGFSAGREGTIPKITVTGEAEVQVPPDEVVVTLGVEVFNKTLGAARKNADATVAKVLALGEKFAIAKGDMQTDHASFDVSLDWDKRSEGTVSGYWSRKIVVATLRDLSQFEGFVAAVIEAGVNNMHGIQFRTSELRKHRDQARELALKAAREKAQALATQAGAKLGKPIEIRESVDRWSSPWGSWWGGSRGGSMTQNVSQISNVGTQSAGSSTAPGRISVSATIEATYALE